MRHHRQRDDGQHRLQQHEVIVVETVRSVSGEGIADSGSARRIVGIAEADDLGEIIGGAGIGKLVQQRKIDLRLRAGETPAQIAPGVAAASGSLSFADKMADRASQDNLLVFVAALELAGLNSVEVAPPSVGIAGPLRMQCPHPGEGTPQRYAGADEALTQAIEQRSGLGATESFADRPDMQFDDFSPERSVEALREWRHSRRWRHFGHGFSLYRNRPGRATGSSIQGSRSVSRARCLGLTACFLHATPGVLYRPVGW